MTERLVFDAGVVDWALAAAALLVLAASLRFLRALPWPLRLLRACSLALLAALLLRPAVDTLRERSSKPRLAVLIDSGPSMRALDDQGLARLARAVRWLKRHRSALEARAELSLFAAAGGARRVGFDELDRLESASASLEAGAAAADVLDSGPPPARVLLLSDGASDSPEPLEGGLARLGAPVDTAGVGPRRVRPALAVSAVQAPDFVFLHGRFPVSASVEATELAGARVQVRLHKGDKLVGSAEFEADKPFTVFQASFTAEAGSLGRESYRLSASAVSPDGKTIETARGLRVEVIRQKTRIMYLAGRPSFEYSHLREHLKSDPNHELVSFVILRNPENFSPVPDSDLSLIPFPAQEIFVQSLFQFDLFILENFAYTRFSLPVSYLQSLRKFVQEGGALLLIGGSNAFTKGGYQGTALEDILPAALWPDADDYRPGLFQPVVAAPSNPLMSLGETPEASAELWKALPPLDGWVRLASLRPGASVLLRHPSEKTPAGDPLPVVALREFGKGKVMIVGTESSWRWKLAGGGDWRLASFYSRFWNRAVEYLTGSLDLKKVKFSPLPDRMPPREPAVAALRTFDEHFRPLPGSETDLRVLWTPPGAKAPRSTAFFEREPGLFQVELADLAEGRHRLRAVARRRGQPWGEDETEFLWQKVKGDAPLDRKRLKAVAERTGGRYADLDRLEPSALLEGLAPPKRERLASSRRALWGSPAWLWTLCALLFAEWFLRRRGGWL
ncbi:MAG TPA: hypothetical protein DCM05_07650 [Elusimicrobia bacterium]|nr:hypothetical protein [Elusimicrobiota bacterium]